VLQVGEDGPRRRRCCADVPDTNAAVSSAANDLRRQSDASSQFEMYSNGAHVLRMNFAPTAVEYRIICRKNSLASAFNQRPRKPCARAEADLNGSAVPLLNGHSDLPVADDSKVLTAANNKPGAQVTGSTRKTLVPVELSPVLMKRRVSHAAWTELCG
jgi:hypothetical protein